MVKVQCETWGLADGGTDSFFISTDLMQSTEPLLDQHMLVFTSKCFPCTSKKHLVAGTIIYIPAETERFV